MKILKILFMLIIISHPIVGSAMLNSSQVELVTHNLCNLVENNEQAFAMTAFTLTAAAVRYAIHSQTKSNYIAEQSHFTIRELNYENELEIAQVIEIFQDLEVQKMTSKTPDQITGIINCIKCAQYIESIIIYQDNESTKIQGMLLSCVINYRSHHNTYIRAIATHKDFRRNKIASSLLQHAEEIAQKNHSIAMSLHVYSDNNKAIQCYTKYGFTRDGNSMYKILSKYSLFFLRLQNIINF